MKTYSALLAAITAMLMAATVYADEAGPDVSDIDQLSMSVLEAGDDLPEAVFRELVLPESASERAVERAQNREGYGLSRANEVRALAAERRAAREGNEGDAQDAADQAQDARERAKEVSKEKKDNAAERAAEAKENAAEKSVDGQEAAEAANQNAAEAAADGQARAAEARANAQAGRPE